MPKKMYRHKNKLDVTEIKRVYRYVAETSSGFEEFVEELRLRCPRPTATLTERVPVYLFWRGEIYDLLKSTFPEKIRQIVGVCSSEVVEVNKFFLYFSRNVSNERCFD